MEGRDHSGRRSALVAAVTGVGVAALLATGAMFSPAPSGSSAAPGPAASVPISAEVTGSVATGSVTTGAAPSGTGSTPTTPPSRPAPGSAPSPAPAAELPRGGRELFPRYRLLGFSGGPGTAAFGRLGVGRLDDRVREIEKLAGSYRTGGRQVLPVLELITVVVHASPGPDGMYRSRIDEEVIERHLAAARRHQALLLLNVQPGRARFLDEVKGLQRWLVEPDVGLALDPEWAVTAPKVPGRSYGSVTGAELDAVSAYVADLVARHDLPEKPVVVHQLAPSILRGGSALTQRDGVVMIKSVDGIGSPGAKVDTWRRLTTSMSTVFHPGFKLFFDEDGEGGSRLMTAGEVMALTPRPEYVLYE